jgi:hypothetical protein
MQHRNTLINDLEKRDKHWTRSLALRTAAKMPLLRHYHPGRRFDIQESEVVDWLVAQPEVRQMVFNLCKRAGAIQFDVETGGWRGAREPTDNHNPANLKTNQAVDAYRRALVHERLRDDIARRRGRSSARSSDDVRRRSCLRVRENRAVVASRLTQTRTNKP